MLKIYIFKENEDKVISDKQHKCDEANIWLGIAAISIVIFIWQT